MKKVVLTTLIACCAFLTADAQKQKVDLNTVFVCIDSTTYATLFKNSFVKDTLFYCRTQQTQTNIESYNGKYAIGKSATLEFFKPVKSAALGDQFGDVGIEFKTRKLNDLSNYIKLTKQKKLAFKLDTSKVELSNKRINWYQAFTLKNPLANRFAISILEYQKEYLLAQGFTAQELANSMTYEQYNTIISDGKKYPRHFNNINYLSLAINQHEFVTLKNMATLLGLVQKGFSFIGNDLKIDYKIEKTASFKLKKIGIKLTENLGNRTVIVSENLLIATQGNLASLSFNY